MRRYWRRLSSREQYLAVTIPLGLFIASVGFAEMVGWLHVRPLVAQTVATAWFALWLEFIRPERWQR